MARNEDLTRQDNRKQGSRDWIINMKREDKASGLRKPRIRLGDLNGLGIYLLIAEGEYGASEAI